MFMCHVLEQYNLVTGGSTTVCRRGASFSTIVAGSAEDYERLVQEATGARELAQQ